MATLTETASLFRKTVIFAIIAFISGIVIYIVALMVIANYKQQNPPEPPKPTVAFGKLPPIPFPTNVAYPTEFQLLTIEGRPPEGSTSAKVYFIPKKSPTLFSRKNAEGFAKKLGFTQPPTQLDVLTNQYTDETTQSTLTIDITNSNFLYRSNFIDVTVFNENANSLTEQQIVNLARTYFANLSVWDEKLTESKVSYFRFDGSVLIPTTKAKEAQAIRVDFFKKEIEKTPIVTTGFTTSSIYIMFAPSQGKIGQTLEASFYNFPADTSVDATYPMINGTTAWELLKDGKGYIARPLAAETPAVVRNIYLAYLENTVYTPYVQPVWVFEGDFDFVGIVPAIEGAWIGQ